MTVPSISLVLLFWLLTGPAVASAQPERDEQPADQTSADEEQDEVDEGDSEPSPSPRERPRARPRGVRSNTGYVDSALVGSFVRLRFDAGFNAERPDRAEFFYGKCGCFTARAGQDSTGAPGPVEGPGFKVDADGRRVPVPDGDLDFQEFQLALEYAFSDRFSLFFEAGVRSLDGNQFSPRSNTPEFPDNLEGFSSSGLGDARVGVKYALVARPDRYLTAQLRAYLPTGDAAEGLGTDHASVEPALLYLRRFSDRTTFESELRLWHPLSGSSDPVTGGSRLASVGRDERPSPPNPNPVPDPPVRNDDYTADIVRLGLGLSYEIPLRSPFRVTEVLEVVGWYVTDGYAAVHKVSSAGRQHWAEAAGDTIVNVKLGFRVRRRGPGSVYAGYGLALTGDGWYENIVRLEYRRTF